MLEVGTVIDGKYKILSKVGQGGMSVVYLALNERANKTWAVKEVRKDGAQDYAAVKQGLAAEVNILKKLDHRYLPSIIDILDDEETFIIVMDYIEGRSLQDMLLERLSKESRPAAVEDVISWGVMLCEVLHYLHTRKDPIIYRDMKPSNVMLRPEGQISLIDFGTARIFKGGNTDDTTCLGTPGYAAPEQYGGRGQSCPGSDIYGLGATLHYLVTGCNPAETPFHFPPITRCRPSLFEETSRELRDKLLGLEMIIDRCTRYNVESRYQSCVRLQYDLEHPEELGLPHRKRLKKRMGVFLTSAGMALAMGGASLAGAILAGRAKTTGYDYYMDNSVTATGDEQLALYRKAIALKPWREEAWLGLLDAIGADNRFTAEEDAYIVSALNTKEAGRSRENKACFRQNEGGYVRFAYHLGMLYYYGEGEGQNKAAAGGWFEIVGRAELSKLDLGTDNRKKAAWKARAEILGKISGYNSRIGQTNQAGDAQVSYLDYWKDLTALVDDKVAGRDNVVTELRLYNEIVFQICTHCDAFCEAGLRQEEMERVLAHIEESVCPLRTEKNSAAGVLREDILRAVGIGRRQLRAIFASEDKKAFERHLEGR